MKPPNLLELFKYFPIALLFTPAALFAQAGFDDDRVLLQGFYWESYRHGHPEWFPGLRAGGWYEIVTEKAPEIRQGRFDLIWLPPPSFAGGVPVTARGNISTSTTATATTSSIAPCWKHCCRTASNR